MNPRYSFDRKGRCSLALGTVLLAAVPAHAQELNTDWWHTSGGGVHSMVASPDGSVIYMGGAFNYIGPVITYSALLDLEQGQPTAGLPTPDNWVSCSVADGAGGWYIGGIFTEVGGQPRPRLAHINADGSLAPWQVDVGPGEVISLCLDGSTLYFGGTFATVAGETRSGVAAVDASTGALRPFAPQLGGTLFPRARAVLVAGQNLVMGGDFETVDGTARDYLAAVDKVTGALASWAPNPVNQVFSLAPSEDGASFYVGGTFITIAGQSRSRTAAFNASTLALLPWTVAASDVVNSMDVEDGVMVLGGEFETLGGQPRENLGVVDASTGAVLPLLADTDDDVYAVAIHNGIVHAAGTFRELNGVVRRHIGAVDLASGEVTTWDPVSGNDVYTLSVSDDQLFAGGWFTSIGGKVRNKLMAMDPATGRPTDWDAGAVNDYGSVASLCLSSDGQVLYAAGSFNNEVIGGQQRKHMVAIDVNTGLALPWAPQPNDQVAAIEISPDGGVIYAAGNFMSVGGEQRRRLAAFNADPQQTQLLPWNPDCTSGSVLCIELSADGSTLYAGGTFQAATGTIGGQPRDRMVALSTTSDLNNATPWLAPVSGPSVPPLSAAVYSMLLDPSGETLYLGGVFSAAAGHAVSGQARDYLAAVSTATGAATAWNPGANDRIIELKWSLAGDLMITGVFEGDNAIGGQDRQGFAYVDPLSGAVRPFSPTFNFGGFGSEAEEFDGVLVLSGFFNTVNEQMRLALAAFDLGFASVDDRGDAAPIRIFPNPATDELRLPNVPGARSIALYDAMGRTALHTGYRPVLRLDVLSPGAYVLVLRDMEQREIGRSTVILER
ncbi:MAG: hypothetical protein JNL43_11750 [Flavobacteriales bacterium]|nr:hypothetical protein [Flavobacteriales bacterium]